VKFTQTALCALSSRVPLRYGLYGVMCNSGTLIYVRWLFIGLISASAKGERRRRACWNIDYGV